MTPEQFLDWITSDACKRQFLQISADQIQKNLDFGFERDVDPHGTPWVPLSQSYLASKRKRLSKHPRDKLELTGALRRASREYTIDGTRGLRFTLGTKAASYGAVHMTGSKNLPKRPFYLVDGEPLPDRFRVGIVEGITRLILAVTH
ncbi:MAG TPA: phage virion morphogenesis protein [Deinococcales bacterium]|nr:phage virion morphogenesis protein [Deinococcales bacterium]